MLEPHMILLLTSRTLNIESKREGLQIRWISSLCFTLKHLLLKIYISRTCIILTVVFRGLKSMTYEISMIFLYLIEQFIKPLDK